MMTIAGGRQRVWIGVWILAALSLGALNGYWFMEMEQRPLLGYSQTIRSLQAGLVSFENKLTSGDFSLNSISDFQTAFKIDGADKKAVEETATVPAGSGQAARMDQAPKLPVLSGIIQVMGPHGNIDFQAVLNGRTCREKDKAGGFIVDRISTAGVVLRRSQDKWFIKSPTPYYSSDQGD